VTRFSATTFSEATVPAPRADIWALLTDPDTLVRLTPLLRRIETDGDVWSWHLIEISALGISIRPSFTEQMTFRPTERIDYVHQPPAGTTERQGADGWYELTEVPGGTHLAISLTLHIDLPLSGLARPAVTRVMKATMQRTGDRFSANMLHELGITPSAFPA
jgi:carbon monoxide dehydrogenase subunit G